MKRALKIAVVTETFPPEVNGVAMTIDVMVRGLIERNHYVEVIRPQQPADKYPSTRARHAEVLVKGFPIPGYGSLRAGLPATRLLLQRWRAVRPDVIQLVTEGPLGYSAVRAARKLGIPVASEYHTNFNAYARHYGQAWLSRAVASYLKHLHNSTAATMVPTRELAVALEQSGYRRVRVVSRGVDTRIFTPDQRSGALRRSWGAAPDAPVVMHVGRLAPEKNLDLLFEAFEAIRTDMPRARLVIVGDGPEGQRLANRYRGHFFAGIQRGHSLAAHYASADIFLYPSLTETFGNVTLEAMASGLAIVAFDYAAAHDHLRHGVNGLLAQYGNRDDFKQLAARLTANPHQYARLGRAARAAALSVDWHRVIEALESTLLSLAGQVARTDPRPAVLSRGAAS
jgi:glycosyltransferase involved in cell wall biosynthesis